MTQPRTNWTILYISVAFLLFFGMGQVTNFITIPLLNNLRPLGGYDCKAAAVYCVGKDTASEYSVIGGATLSGGTTNAAGSAAKAVEDAGHTASNRATIVVGPGRWNEAVIVPAWTTLHVLAGAEIRPTVTAANDIDGGVVRIAADPNTPQFGSTGIEIRVDGIIQNDAFPYGNLAFNELHEAAIVVGVEGTSTGTGWDNLRITGTGQIIGNDQAIFFDGKSGTGTDQIPSVTIDGPELIGGSLAIGRAHLTQLEVRNVLMVANPNYCEDPNSDLTDAIGPTAVDAGAGSTTTFRVASADAFFADDKIVGRLVTFAGGGLCGANGDTAQITSYVSATRIATFRPAASATLDDADCTYTVAEVPNARHSPCQDIDWTPLRAEATAFGYGLTGCMTTHSSTGSSDGTLDEVRFLNSLCDVTIRDFGLDSSASECGIGGVVGGILEVGTDNDVERISMQSFSMRIRLESDMKANSGTCSYGVTGLALLGTTNSLNIMEYDIGRILIQNTGDLDVNIAGVDHRAIDTAIKYSLSRLKIDIETPVGYTGTVMHIDDFASIAGSLITKDIITGDAAFNVKTYGATYKSSLSPMLTDGATGTADLDMSGNSDALEVPIAELVRITAGGSRVVGGIKTNYSGRRWCGYIDDANQVTWEHQEATATANDRIITYNGLDVIQSQNESACWLYDLTADRWRLYSFAGDPNS